MGFQALVIKQVAVVFVICDFLHAFVIARVSYLNLQLSVSCDLEREFTLI